MLVASEVVEHSCSLQCVVQGDYFVIAVVLVKRMGSLWESMSGMQLWTLVEAERMNAVVVHVVVAVAVAVERQ